MRILVMGTGGVGGYFGALLARADFLPPFELFAGVLARGGRAAIMKRLGPESNDAIDELLTLALDYERDHAPSLQGFLHWLRTSQSVIKRDLEHGRDEVRVMTVHGAKGFRRRSSSCPTRAACPPPSPACWGPRPMRNGRRCRCFRRAPPISTRPARPPTRPSSARSQRNIAGCSMSR